MPLPCAVNGIRIGQRPLISAIASQRRAYNVAVVGGGITGLTAAWKLTQDPKCTGITLYEKSNRLGGWMESETIPVDGGHVVFEYGPRTLRWTETTGRLIARMAHSIGLTDQMIFTSKTSPAALNRYIYYPDHLVRLPTPTPSMSTLQYVKHLVGSLLEEPALKPLIPALLFEHTKPARMADEWQKDESISSFISRRFNSQVADNLVSAMMHGIYAGDIDQLSAQTLLGPMRNLEGDGILYSSIARAWTRTQTLVMDDTLVAALHEHQENELPNDLLGLFALGKGATTFTFKGGTQQLLDGLGAALRASSKVNIQTNVDIQTISHQPGNYSPMSISTSEGQKNYDHVISAIPAPALTKILAMPPNSTNHPALEGRPIEKLPSDTVQKLKSFDHASTVMVVNLYYNDPDLLPIDGFGYLIPRSTPADQNPECGLGVIFASESSSGVSLGEEEHLPEEDDHVIRVNHSSQDTAEGTKLTVMMGGHYWDHFNPSDYPDHDTAVLMARAILGRHLGITAEPAIARSRLQKDAIPQYTVGHLDRMYELSNTVKRDFDQRLVITGNWYNGIGVGDCVRQGMMAATFGIRSKPKSPGDQSPDDLTVASPDVGIDYQSWDLLGGVPTAPIRYVDGVAKR